MGLDTLVTDKQWILKHSTSFGIVGLVVVVILLLPFLIYRLTRPIERRLERNWYVVGTAIIQAVLFLTSMTVGFCQGRTVTQGGQIAILVCYITNANILLLSGYHFRSWPSSMDSKAMHSKLDSACFVTFWEPASSSSPGQQVHTGSSGKHGMPTWPPCLPYPTSYPSSTRL